MEEKKAQSISVAIADRNYPFSIDPEDEEVMRMAAKKIAERLENYKSKYAIRDSQDALAITVLQFVVQLIKEKKKDVSGTIVDELQLLNTQLDEYIETNMK